MRNIAISIAVLLTASTTGFADDDKPVPKSGAPSLKCDGVSDDTASLKALILATPSNGIVTIPAGKCKVSDTIVISGPRPVSIVGSGRASQIFQSADKTLFDFQAIQSRGSKSIQIKDLYLGSAATSEGAALIKLTNSSGILIDNITMLGSYYGLYLNGSASNSIISLRSGINFGGFYNSIGLSTNQYWVFADRFNGKSANANTFTALGLEGGHNGLFLVDGSGEGSLTINGGTIEGADTGLQLERTSGNSTITGLHLEGNRIADVVLLDTTNVKMAGVLSNTSILVKGASSNVSLSDSQVEVVKLDSVPPASVDAGYTNVPARNIRLQNISACTNGVVGIDPRPTNDPDFGSPNGISSPKVLAGDGSVRTDIIYVNVGYICAGE